MDIEPVDSRCDTVRMSKAEIAEILARHAEEAAAHDRDTLPAPPPVTGE